MKNPNRTNDKKGFTLVELLVVMAIIVVLAAAGFAGANAVREKAKRTSAQAAATSLLTGIEQFYSEYTSLPDLGDGVSEVNTSDPELLNILAGLETTPPIQNDRKMRMLTIKEAKNGNRDGLVYNTSGAITGLYDPWEQPYYVVLDIDYDERVSFTPQGSPPVTLNGRRAAVYSLGTDTPADAKPNTLVKTW